MHEYVPMGVMFQILTQTFHALHKWSLRRCREKSTKPNQLIIFLLHGSTSDKASIVNVVVMLLYVVGYFWILIATDNLKTDKL